MVPVIFQISNFYRRTIRNVLWNSAIKRLMNASIVVIGVKVNESNGPVNIAYKQSFLIAWNTENVTDCNANFVRNNLASDKKQMPGLTASTAYQLTCLNSLGEEVSDSITINVGDAPEVSVNLILNDSDTPDAITQGQQIKG
jgi:hypothetical protein